jgi:hypothetical protein
MPEFFPGPSAELKHLKAKYMSEKPTNYLRSKGWKGKANSWRCGELFAVSKIEGRAGELQSCGSSLLGKENKR